jgi:hypothetical protein
MAEVSLELTIFAFVISFSVVLAVTIIAHFLLWNIGKGRNVRKVNSEIAKVNSEIAKVKSEIGKAPNKQQRELNKKLHTLNKQRKDIEEKLEQTRLSYSHWRDIIRDDNWYPSLSQFQCVAWTLVISFLFLGVYLTRVFGGVFEVQPSLPNNLFVLMGLSVVVVPVASSTISSYKYTGKTPLTPEEVKKTYPLRTMLEENGKASLSRFQMFIWTFIGIIVYLCIFFGMLIKPGSLQDVQKLVMPDIDPTFLILMGISQGAYIGGKYITPQSTEITKISPERAKVGETIFVYGTNFGKDKDNLQFKDKDDKSVTADKDKDIDDWTDSRISVKVPAALTPGSYKVVVRVNRSEAESPLDKFSVVA